MIKFRCKCGQKISVPEEYAGTKGKCPKCKENVIVPLINKNSSSHTSEISSSKIDPEICSRCYETIPSDSPRETIDKQTVCLKCFELYTKRQLSLKTQNNDRKNNGPRLAFCVLGMLVIFLVSSLVWFFVIRDTWEIDHYAEISEMISETQSYISENNFDGATKSL